MKKCSRCKFEKPLEEFPKFQNRCKECTNQYMRGYYERNAEKIRSRFSLGIRCGG